MEKKHTPEPWAIRRTWDGKPVLDIEGPLPDHCHEIARLPIFTTRVEANARRIVACVNACAGISTEDIESGKLGNILAGRIFDQIPHSQMSETKHCLQCGAILLLNAVPADPLYPQGTQVPACSACRSRDFDVPGNKIQELTAQRDELLAALKREHATRPGYHDEEHCPVCALIEKYHA